MTNDGRSGASFVIRRPSFVLTQTLSDVPAESSWLSPQESARAAQFRFPKRRSDWLLGRWTAKVAVQRYLGRSGISVQLPSIEIRSAPDGAPDVCLQGSSARVSLSLSHSSGTSLVAVTEAGTPLGCDVERVEPRSPEFLLDYFTEEERAFVAGAPEGERAFRCTLVWSTKESALKWLREGLRLDTRSVSVTIGDRQPGWSPLAVTCAERLTGWWHAEAGLIQTIVGKALLPPLQL